MSSLQVGTMNILNTFQYERRGDLCRTVLAGSPCDLLGLQEVNMKARQAQEISKAITRKNQRYGDAFAAIDGPVRTSFTHPSVKGFRIDGNAVIVKSSRMVVLEHSTKHLSDFRSATRVLARVDDIVVSFTTVHLHHTPRHPSVRAQQVASLLVWVMARDAADSVQLSVLCGDFNATTDEPCYSTVTQQGYDSAHFLVHGKEPEVTWQLSAGLEDFEGAESYPEGLHNLETSTYPTDADSLCLDYIFIKACDPDNFGVSVTSCHLIGTKSLPREPTVFASDHFGVVASLLIERKLSQHV